MDSRIKKHIHCLNYVPTYSSNGYDVDGYFVSIPDIPSDEFILGIDTHKKSQKFFRTALSEDEARSMDADELKIRLAAEYHGRMYGRWHMINGKPYYFPPNSYFYYNYHTTEQGRIPTFRMEGLQFFQFKNSVRRDENAFGTFIIKPRRIGDTDKELGGEILNPLTFVKNFKAGSQNYDEPQARKNFDRTVQSFARLPYFFKPNGHKVMPSKVLDFFPPSNVSPSKIEGLKYLMSKFDFESTVFRKYDGNYLDEYYLDEVGKIKPSQMNFYKQWRVIKPTLALENDALILGKGTITTTVEDITNDGEVIELIQKFWDDSNPLERDGNNRTITGMIRYMRPFWLAGAYDEYGFPLKAESIKVREATLRALEKKNDYDAIVSLKRKQPASIQEALSSAGDDCILNPMALDIRINRVTNKLDHNDNPLQTIEPRSWRGSLEWDSSVFGSVSYVPDPNGRWVFSQMPIAPNNRYGNTPGNKDRYTVGVDPIEEHGDARQKSNGAIAVYRHHDILTDSHTRFDEDGYITNSYELNTGKFVCIYDSRPDEPYEYFLDVVKTAIFYGAPAFIELNKTYVYNMFKQNNLGGYLGKVPKSISTNKVAKTGGLHASQKVIELYVSLLKKHIRQSLDSIDFIELLRDMRKFNHKTRTKCDLTVAAGYALLGSMNYDFKEQVAREDKNFGQLWR